MAGNRSGAAAPQRPGPRSTGVSNKSLTIARILDRICRTPGQYQITITVPSHTKNRWQVIFSKVDKLREMDIKK